MKGIAEIELTDVKSGEKEIFSEKNIVTDVFKEILGFQYGGAYLYSNLFPLYKNGLGGIFIFGDNIEEDKGNYLYPYNNKLIGHAGSRGYSGNITSRGSFNEAESSILENGIKLVFDFNTSQANGEIKCLSLTNESAGYVGLGSKDPKIGDCSYKDIAIYTYSNSNYSKIKASGIDYNYNFKIQGQSIKIDKIISNIVRYSLLSGTKTKIISTLIIDFDYTPKEFSTCYSEDRIYVVIGTQYENKRANLIIINKNTLEIIANHNIDIYWQHFFEYNGSNLYEPIIQVIKDNLYVRKYEYFLMKFYILRMNLKNITDYKVINVANWKNISSNNHPMIKLGNLIVCTDCILDGNDEVTYFGILESSSITGWSVYNDIVLANDSKYGINPYYLATINNLQTPIIKTADKTMKITYIVTDGT